MFITEESDKQWKRETFTTSADAACILFEGVRGGNSKQEVDGEMALDDLKIVTYCGEEGEEGFGQQKYPLLFNYMNNPTLQSVEPLEANIRQVSTKVLLTNDNIFSIYHIEYGLTRAKLQHN